MPYKNKEDTYKAQKRHRIRIRKKLLEFLSTKECADCREKDPIVLEFDHVKSSKKTKGVSRLLAGHYSWETVWGEIKKCEVRCANCHRRKTYRQFSHLGKIKNPL